MNKTDSDVQYRWLDGPMASQEDWDRIELLLSTRGWMSLNRLTSRILIAEREGQLVGFHVFQLVPSAGPLWVKPSDRGSGVAEHLADEMLAFFAETCARGWMVVATNPSSAKLCETRGMHLIKSPVYTTEPVEVDSRGGS